MSKLEETETDTRLRPDEDEDILARPDWVDLLTPFTLIALIVIPVGIALLCFFQPITQKLFDLANP